MIGARVLELYGGTGALSLECLSRGAAHSVCVEKSSRHAQFIRENLGLARLPATALDLRIQDAFAALAQLAAAKQQFDLVLADPPYGEKNVGQRSHSPAQQLLDNADLPKLLSPGGLFVLGHARRDTLSVPGVWEERKLLRHGDSIMRMMSVSN